MSRPEKHFSRLSALQQVVERFGRPGCASAGRGARPDTAAESFSRSSALRQAVREPGACRSVGSLLVRYCDLLKLSWRAHVLGQPAEATDGG